MNGPEIFMLGLTVSQFKQIKKAVKLLTNTGMERETALHIILEAHRNKISHGIYSPAKDVKVVSVR